MPRATKYISLEGVFASGVLGVFKVIRGFADIRRLAEISVPYEMQEGPEVGRVAGHQRQLDEQHAADIRDYLEKSDSRFFPEIILSVRTAIEEVSNPSGDVIGVTSEGDDGVFISRRFSGKNHRAQNVHVLRRRLDEIKRSRLIRRIDGNHRLALADELIDDPNLPGKYLAPFCLVLLGTPDEAADDYAESLIFHTINSTALQLESEHGLKLLLGQDAAYSMTADNEFAYSPELHLTRLLRDRIQLLPRAAKARFGVRHLSCLWETARNLIKMDTSIAVDRTALTTFADELFGGLHDILTRLAPNQPSLCQTHAFLELATLVWRKTPDGDHAVKVNAAVEQLDRIGTWLGREGITNLLNPLSPAKQLLETFHAVQNRIPKRIFLARWYPDQEREGEAFNRARLRLEQIQQMLDFIERETGIKLELIDLGTKTGGTFGIHKEMYEAIASSDIIMLDLTGHRPNVYVEAGYALKHHENNRLILVFEPENDTDKVPFDLNTFRYEEIAQAAEIPGQVRKHIEAILREAGAALPETRRPIT
jgi:hypothetical protein